MSSEYLGADTVLSCSAGDATVLARLPGRAMLSEGDKVCLTFDQPVHLFDAATGHRIPQQEIVA